MQDDGDPLLQPPQPLPMPALNCDAVRVDIVQVEEAVVERKDTVSAVTNDFRISIIASGEREANGAHERIGFAARGRTTSQHQRDRKRKSDPHGEPPVRRQHSRVKTNHL